MVEQEEERGAAGGRPEAPEAHLARPLWHVAPPPVHPDRRLLHEDPGFSFSQGAHQAYVRVPDRLGPLRGVVVSAVENVRHLARDDSLHLPSVRRNPGPVARLQATRLRFAAVTVREQVSTVVDFRLIKGMTDERLRGQRIVGLYAAPSHAGGAGAFLQGVAVGFYELVHHHGYLVEGERARGVT